MFEPIKTSTYFLVLLVLRDGAKHGYEIATSIKDRSQGYFSISFGSLYPVLHKLEKDNLVEAQWQEAGDIKSKKVYQLTDKGSRQMKAELEQFNAIMRAFKDFIGEGQ